MTWNIEGFRRNVHSLKYFTVLHNPCLVFLSEPQLLQCDVAGLLQTFRGCYSYYLNSEDLHLPELALDHTKSKGGTMVMWQTSFDPFITIIPTQSSSLAAVLLQLPGHCISAHIAIYLPTSVNNKQTREGPAVQQLLYYQQANGYQCRNSSIRSSGNKR